MSTTFPNVSSFGTLEVLRRTFMAPRSAFLRLSERPSWIWPLILLVSGNCLLFALIRPYAVEGGLALLPSDATEVQREAAQAQIEFGQKVGLFLVPVAVVAKWALTAALLWSAVNLFVGDMRFDRMFAMTGYAGLVLLVASAYQLLIVMLRRNMPIHSPRDLQVPIGLNLFLQVKSPWLYNLLGHVNLFEIWYVCLLAIGVRALADRCSPRRAATVAVSYWLFVVGVSTAASVLSAASLRVGTS